MDNTARITHSALCQYRFYNVKRFREHLAKVHKFSDDKEAQTIFMHKALTSIREAYETHDMLNTGVELCHIYRDVWDRDIVETVLTAIVPRANAIYAKNEAHMEDMALAKFHREAFGE